MGWDIRMEFFKRVLDCNGIKMIYLTKKEDTNIDMIALVVFTEIKKKMRFRVLIFSNS